MPRYYTTSSSTATIHFLKFPVSDMSSTSSAYSTSSTSSSSSGVVASPLELLSKEVASETVPSPSSLLALPKPTAPSRSSTLVSTTAPSAQILSPLASITAPNEDIDLGLPDDEPITYVWSPSLLYEMGLPLKTKDGKAASLNDEFPMERQRRAALVKGLPDIRDFRDLVPRDRLPQDPDATRHLSDGEKYWITQVAPKLHRQLLQILSIGAFLAQESASHLSEMKDGSGMGLDMVEMANLLGSLVVLTTDSIRSIVDEQRSRTLKASGRRPPPSVPDSQRMIISGKLEDEMAKNAERELNLKMAHPSTLAQVSSALRSGNQSAGQSFNRSFGPIRRHRFPRFRQVRGEYGGRSGYDPEVNSIASPAPQSTRSDSFRYSFSQRGRGRGRGKFSRGGF